VHAPYYWTQWNLPSTGRYILMTEYAQDLKTMVAEPRSALRVVDGEDAVGDVELILELAGRPVAEQADRIAAELSGAKRHSLLLTQYISAILAAGSDSDTVHLAQALDGAGALAFSDEAKGAFVGQLRSDILWPEDSTRTPENLLHTYLNLVIRYFILDAHEGRRGPLRVQDLILWSHLPRIRASERMMAALKRLALSPEDGDLLRREAVRRQSDATLTEAARAEAGRLLQIFPAN
jgi:hypothetical protein